MYCNMTLAAMALYLLTGTSPNGSKDCTNHTFWGHSNKNTFSQSAGWTGGRTSCFCGTVVTLLTQILSVPLQTPSVETLKCIDKLVYHVSSNTDDKVYFLVMSCTLK